MMFDRRSTFFTTTPTLSFVELFVTTCKNNNPPNNQHDSTSNLKDLLDEYKSSVDCWVKDHGSDSDSNMSPSHEKMLKQGW